MPDDKKIQKFLQELAPCIARRDLDVCVEEAAGDGKNGDMGIFYIIICIKSIKR